MFMLSENRLCESLFRSLKDSARGGGVPAIFMEKSGCRAAKPDECS